MGDDPHSANAPLRARIARALRVLGLPESLATSRRQTMHPEATTLELVQVDLSGREHRLEPATARAWRKMHGAALAEGITLEIASAFRSFDYQHGIIARKLAAGQSVAQILEASALPGFSEHHTGRAVDLNTPGCAPFTAAFEETRGFTWLMQSASTYGFTLSYPRDNPHGIGFEPWHWFFSGS